MIRKFFISCVFLLGGLSYLLAAAPNHTDFGSSLQQESVEADLNLIPEAPEALLKSLPYEQPTENFNTEKTTVEEEENLDEDPEPESGKKVVKTFKNFGDIHFAQSQAHFYYADYTSSAARWVDHCPVTISKRYLLIEVFRI